MPRRPTIIDVARYAGVSKSTVARVVSGQGGRVRAVTQERVMAAIEALGYQRNAIAGSLRTDKTHIIGLSIPDISNPFWPEVVRGVQDTLERSSYSVVTVNTDWDSAREATYLKMMRHNRFDGLIINPTDVLHADFQALRIPVVILGSGNGYPDNDSVGSDSEQGAEDALEYLHTLGHRRIGIIVGGSVRHKSSTRHHSYVAFHARKRLPLDEDLIVPCQFSLRTGGSFEAGTKAMKRLLSLDEPPTAVFAANDILAIAALQTAQKLGWQIPKEISIIGMDDIFTASMTSPALTTVAKPLYGLGVEAAKMLLARMQNEIQSVVEHLRLPCRLMERGSTAPPPS